MKAYLWFANSRNYIRRIIIIITLWDDFKGIRAVGWLGNAITRELCVFGLLLPFRHRNAFSDLIRDDSSPSKGVDVFRCVFNITCYVCSCTCKTASGAIPRIKLQINLLPKTCSDRWKWISNRLSVVKDWVGGHAQILKWTAKDEGFYWWYGGREKRDNNIKEESRRWIWFWYDDRFWLTKPQKRHKQWQEKTGHLNWQSKIRWKADYGSGFHSFEGLILLILSQGRRSFQ